MKSTDLLQNTLQIKSEAQLVKYQQLGSVINSTIQFVQKKKRASARLH